MIKSIAYSNLKGRSGSHDLAPFTIISGRNRAGKSAVTTAITLACLGYVPALGKVNKATFRLSSGGTMEAAAKFSDGRSVTRTWKQSGKTINASASTEDVPEFGPILNPAEFIAAKPADRIAILSKLSPAGDDPAVQAMRLAIGHRGPGDGNPFEMAEAAADLHETKSKEAAAAARQWKQTMAGLVELINASGIPAKPTNTATAGLEAALREEAAATKERDALEEKAEAAWSASDELEAIGEVQEGDLSQLKAAYDTAAADTAAASAAVGDAREQLAAANATIQALGRSVRTEKSLGEIEEEIAKIKAGGDQFAAYTAAAKEAQRLRLIVDNLERAEEGAAKDRDELIKSRDLIEGMESCPTCKACAPGWKDVARESYRQLIEDLAARELDAVAKKGPMAAALESAAAEMTRLEEFTKAFEKLPALYTAAENLYAMEAKKKEAAKLAEVLATSEQWHAETVSLRTAAKKAYDTAAENNGNAARLKELRTIAAACPTQEARTAAATRLENATAAVTAARSAIAEEQRANKDFEEAMQREKDRAAAEKNLAEAEEEQDRQTAKAKEIREKMKAAMKSLFGPVLKYAGPLSRAVMGGQELTLNADGEIGVQSDLSFIPFEVLSGTEQLIATSAIQAGLSAAVGGVVIVDEFSRVDAENKRILANALQEMQKAGTLAQVIIVDHDAAFAAIMAQGGAAVVKV
jgi:hypothetical protein